MAILCLVDTEDPSRAAALEVAAHLASRAQTSLHLLIEVDAEERSALEVAARRQLNADKALLARFRVPIGTHVVRGKLDESIQSVALCADADMLVTSPTLALRAQTIAHQPMLVVREVGPFAAWTRGEQPLRIVLGSDQTEASRSAVAWSTRLSSFGKCELTLVRLYWPPEQYDRLGLEGVRDYATPDPEVTRTIERELLGSVPEGIHDVTLQTRVEPFVGDVALRLLSIAKEQHAELVVVGTHQRGPLRRMVEGSVSRRMLAKSGTAVACIPALEGAPPVQRPMRTVLLATDFSAMTRAALPLAYEIAGRLGTVHLVHVIEGHRHDHIEQHDIFAESAVPAVVAQREEALRSMRNLVPPQSGAATELHVVESHDAARAICQAAERLGVDVICLGTHGRTGLVEAVMGSVAHDVLGRTQRPVLLAHPPAA